MAKNKTFETDGSVTRFLQAVDNEVKRNDCFEITEMISNESGLEAKMWGSAIVGFGSYHYKYDSGHEGDAPLVGFSPRKNAITLYIALNADDKARLLRDFGKYKLGKSCIYINQLKDINEEILRHMIRTSLAYMQQLYG